MNSLFSSLDLFDYLVFFLIIACTIASVFWAKRRFQSAETKSYLDYILLGRQLTLPLFVATLVATWYGGIIGVTAIAYKKGIFNFVTQGLFWYGSYIIFAFFVLPRLRGSEALTFPELVGQKFGAKAKKVAALLNFVNVIPVTYTISIGVLITALLGTSTYLSMFIGVMFVCLYSAKSGFLSVVFTDLIQFFVMCLAVLVVIIFSLEQHGGFSFLTANLPTHYFELTADEGWLATLTWGFIAMATLIDPNFYQRCLAARSEKVAKSGILISTMIWCVFDLCTTFGAMYAAAVMPGQNPNSAYLSYALDLLPSGFRGLFVAGIMATILSSLDSYLFIAANTVQYDLRPNARFKIANQVLTVFAVGIFSILVAFLFNSDIKLIWKSLGSMFSGCLLLPVLIGFTKHNPLNEKNFLKCVAASMLTMAISTLFPLSFNGLEIDSVYVGISTSSLMILLFFLRKKQNSLN